MKLLHLTILTVLLSPAFILPDFSIAEDSPPEPTKQQPKTGDKWTEPLTGMEMVWLDGGCYVMGQIPLETRLLIREVGESDYKKYYADELPRHKVCLSGFWIGTTEVTQAQWLKVMGYNPANFDTDENFPVDSVSWQDAINFIAKINKGNNSDEFRLPTEAEWEYAARGGSSPDTFYHTGNSITPRQANFNGSIPFGLNLRDEYRKTPVPVASFAPNNFNLYDMHGNVWEWCNDWYAEDYYETSLPQNPTGPEEGNMRVLRGGSWFRYSGHIRAATRYKNKPTGQFADTGFRVVKSKLKSGNKETGTIVFDTDF